MNFSADNGMMDRGQIDIMMGKRQKIEGRMRMMGIRITEMDVHPIAIGNLDFAGMALFKGRWEKNVNLRSYMEKMELSLIL